MSAGVEIGASYFHGHSQEFSAGGREYVVGWDKPVALGEARKKCASIGAILAEIYDQETLDSVK